MDPPLPPSLSPDLKCRGCHCEQPRLSVVYLQGYEGLGKAALRCRGRGLLNTGHPIFLRAPEAYSNVTQAVSKSILIDSRRFGSVNPGFGVPRNAMGVTCGITLESGPKFKIISIATC